MEAMVKWVQLSSLNVSYNSPSSYRDPLPNNHTHSFGQVLSAMTALTKPNMNGISHPYYCTSVIGGLLGFLPTQLEVLTMADTNLNIDSSFCAVLSRMTALRKLDMNRCCLTGRDVKLLTPALANSHALTWLKMNAIRGLTSEVEVSALVRGLTQLQLLHLEFCGLMDHHVAEFVRSLHDHHRLTSLSLADNILANETSRALAAWPQLLCLEEIGLNKPDTEVYVNTSVAEEVLQQSLSFRRTVHRDKGLQRATWDAFKRNAIRHTTLLSKCDDPERVKGSISVCKKR